MYRKKDICHCTPSCDTVAVEKSAAVSGCNILAKNSDRETDECQNLKFFPAEKHAPGEMVKCTYIEVPQAEQTYAMIGSQPWWIWAVAPGPGERPHGVSGHARDHRPPGKVRPGRRMRVHESGR